MNHPFPTGPKVPPREAHIVLAIEGGVLFNSALLMKGEMIDQHVHSKPHPTFIGSGQARLWVDKVWKGDYGQAQAVTIEAGKYHAFEALEDNTLITCVWEEKVGEEMLREAGHAV